RSRFHPCAIQDKSNNRVAAAFECIRLLSLSGHAANWGICGAFARHATRLFHVLSLAIERNQRIGIRRTSFYVCILGSEGGTPVENLPVGSVSRIFGEHSFAVDLLRAAAVSHGSVPNEGNTRALASALSCASDCFRSGSQPAAGAKYDSVSFAT